MSSTDVNLAQHFIQYILNINPEERPSVLRMKRHLLMKSVSNPFAKELLQRMSQEINPFRKAQSEQDRNSRGDVSSEMKALNSSTIPPHDKGMHSLIL